jgi:hypothetical protein
MPADPNQQTPVTTEEDIAQPEKLQIATHFGPSEEVAYFGNVCCTVRHYGPGNWTWRSMLMADGFVQKVKVGTEKDRVDACVAAFEAAKELSNV